MGGWHMNVGSGWWIVGPIMMIVFWGGLFWLVSGIIRQRPSAPNVDAGISAKEIAARRFAAGEIGETEYDQIISRLEE